MTETNFKTGAIIEQVEDILANNDLQDQLVSLIRRIVSTPKVGIFNPFVNSPWLTTPLETLFSFMHIFTILFVLYQLVFLLALPTAGVNCWTVKPLVSFDGLFLNFKYTCYSVLISLVIRFLAYLICDTTFSIVYMVITILTFVRAITFSYALLSQKPWKEIHEHVMNMIKSPTYRQVIYSWSELGLLLASPEANGSKTYLDARLKFIERWNTITANISRVPKTEDPLTYLDFKIPENGLHPVESANLILMKSRAISFLVMVINATESTEFDNIEKYRNIVCFKLAGLKLEYMVNVHTIFLLFAHEAVDKQDVLTQKWDQYRNSLTF